MFNRYNLFVVNRRQHCIFRSRIWPFLWKNASYVNCNILWAFYIKYTLILFHFSQYLLIKFLHLPVVNKLKFYLEQQHKFHQLRLKFNNLNLHYHQKYRQIIYSQRYLSICFKCQFLLSFRFFFVFVLLMSLILYLFYLFFFLVINPPYSITKVIKYYLYLRNLYMCKWKVTAVVRLIVYF